MTDARTDSRSGNLDVNQGFWDEIAPLHAESAFYDVQAFLRGACTLGDIELAEVGDVGGVRMAHLMCHFGMDSLSWARRGAYVTGVDFSAEALRIASGLSERTGLPARFVRADVCRVHEVLPHDFDLVFLSRGILMWIEDIEAFARATVALLRPGGRYYLLDNHPLSLAICRTPDGFEMTDSYFHRSEPRRVVSDSSYAVVDAGLRNTETREWTHPIGDVASALIDAGLAIESLHEFPDAEDPRMPGMFSLRGVRADTATRLRVDSADTVDRAR